MHIYAFGSICRGDISVESDIDLLALVESRDPRLDPQKFSIYSYKRIGELWATGNAFAWHLALESKLVHSEDGRDFLKGLGMPSDYISVVEDCRRFREIFESALLSVQQDTPSLVFELSTVFLAIRNTATCFSLAMSPNPTFGRDSARKLGRRSIPISDNVYSTLMQARLLSTRGVGDDIAEINMHSLLNELESCRLWMNELCLEAEANGRIC
ncbi:nucleotidyltransferase domain-containing protein [Pelagibius sp.]|uniref:nucleotidyltransferase domain-containing protein n=1 Tax=Pelagibius sp. TaxID=1931238 RepID=UPI00262954A6|nr:nucleotidyltransferase domain-containing protein [Pelagibius sp.]